MGIQGRVKVYRGSVKVYRGSVKVYRGRVKVYRGRVKVYRGAAGPAVDPDRLVSVKPEPGSEANACRRRGSRATAPAAGSPDILLRIKREERLSLSEVSESSSCHSPGEPVITSVFSLQTEKTKDVRGMHHGNRPKAQATQRQKQFLSLPDIKKQPDYVKLSEGDSAPGRTAVTPREQFASQPIKQEQPDYVTVSAGDSVPGALRETPTQDSDTDAPPPSPGNLAPNSHDIPATSPPSLGAHRVRKYTNRELDVLVHMVMENYPKLFGKEAAKTPNVVKEAIWQAVADEITALGVDIRTPEKVKKRWLSAKRTMKKKVGEAAQHIAETGRRPPAYLRLTPHEQRLRDFFMPDFRENIQWSRNEVDPPEEDGPPEGTSSEFSTGVPVSPLREEEEPEASEELSEEPTATSPGPQVYQPDQVNENGPKAYQPSDNHITESPRRYTKDSSHQRERPCSPNSPELLMQMHETHLSSINVTLCRQSRTLHDISSRQRKSNVLMQEQNAILSKIAHTLNVLQIQQADGLTALGDIFQKGMESMKLASGPPREGSKRTVDASSLQGALRRPTLPCPRPSDDQISVPPKRKIT
ncbi:uncharacterized protein LOC128484211 [Spea bombifrons]|uniref:uncharacterized protein LOC128484211 n=1 Tax=Spea bombifrons TaxID=233779 RepID=UPI00234C0294|nr:uncharacterized protein LOC128484211 [Spea bombifrons]